MPAVDAAIGEVLSTWSLMEHGHHLASCDTYIAGRILRVFDHQAPRAIKSPSPWFYSARATKRALALYTITIDRVYDSKAWRYAEHNRTESIIVRTSKSEVEVTNNKKLRSRYCTIDATKLTTDRHEASPGLLATAELLVRKIILRATFASLILCPYLASFRSYKGSKMTILNTMSPQQKQKCGVTSEFQFLAWLVSEIWLFINLKSGDCFYHRRH